MILLGLIYTVKSIDSLTTDFFHGESFNLRDYLVSLLTLQLRKRSTERLLPEITQQVFFP